MVAFCFGRGRDTTGFTPGSVLAGAASKTHVVQYGGASLYMCICMHAAPGGIIMISMLIPHACMHVL